MAAITTSTRDAMSSSFSRMPSMTRPLEIGISRIGWMTGGAKARWIDEEMADVIAAQGVRFIDEHRDEPWRGGDTSKEPIQHDAMASGVGGNRQRT